MEWYIIFSKEGKERAPEKKLLLVLVLYGIKNVLQIN